MTWIILSWKSMQSPNNPVLRGKNYFLLDILGGKWVNAFIKVAEKKYGCTVHNIVTHSTGWTESSVKFSKDRFLCPLQKKVKFSSNHRLTLSASVTFKSKTNQLINSYWQIAIWTMIFFKIQPCLAKLWKYHFRQALQDYYILHQRNFWETESFGYTGS